jgi:hypothetical protein
VQAPGLLVQASASHALDDLPLREQEHEDQRQCAEYGPGHLQGIDDPDPADDRADSDAPTAGPQWPGRWHPPIVTPD